MPNGRLNAARNFNRESFTFDYLLFFFDRGGFAMEFSILSVKFVPYFSDVFSRKSCCETNVTLNWGTLNGRRRLFTTGDGFGKAGLLAHRAALVSCDTREKVRSGLEVVRKTFLIFDFSPEGCGRDVEGIGVTFPCNTFAASSGSLPQRQDVVLSNRRCLANLSIISAHTYLPQNLAHCSALRPLP